MQHYGASINSTVLAVRESPARGRKRGGVAFAADTGQPAPRIPSCEAALHNPTDRLCADYEQALRNFLEDARRPCNTPGYTRADDLSCVPKEGFLDRLFTA